MVVPWSCSSARARWARSPRRATRPRAGKGVSSSSRASRGSARPRSSPGSSAIWGRTRGCCSAPATTSRSRGRSARFTISIGTVSVPLEQALSRGRRVARDPQPADRRARAAAAARPCSCSRTCTGPTTRRSTRSPCSGGGSARCRRCVVLTYRPGEAAHPLRAALGAIRADDAVFLELAPLSERAVASLAGEDADEVYAVTEGNPFFVTELLASRGGDDLPPSVAELGARAGVAPRRGREAAGRAGLGRPGPRRHVGAGRGDARVARGGRGARAPRAARGRARGTSASGTSSRATRSGRASRAPRRAA